MEEESETPLAQGTPRIKVSDLEMNPAAKLSTAMLVNQAEELALLHRQGKWKIDPRELAENEAEKFLWGKATDDLIDLVNASTGCVVERSDIIELAIEWSENPPRKSFHEKMRI